MLEGAPGFETQPNKNKGLEDREGQPITLEEFLRGIDFKALRSLFEEEFKKSGLDPQKLKFPSDDLNSISEIPEWLTRLIPIFKHIEGTYNVRTNEVGIKIFEEKEELRENIVSKFKVLHTLIHEFTHAASDWEDGFIGTVRAGFSTLKTFTALTEAVTERLAQEITIEYIRRTTYAGGLDAWKRLSTGADGYGHLIGREDRKAEIHKKYFDNEFGSYTDERKVLQKIIDIISKDTGVPTEVVWRGFVRSYFEQQDLRDPELQSLIEEAFHPGFIKKLRDLRSAGDEENVERLFDVKFTGSFKEKLALGFKKFAHK